MRLVVRPFPSPGSPLPPIADTVAVWQAWLDQPVVPVADLHQVLLPEERARAERLRHPRIRDQFVRSRGLLRVLLSQYLQQPPASIQIDYSPDGKPVLAGPRRLEFNLSHTGGLALFAVSAVPVGVDVEAVREISTMDGLVERFFAATERAQYQTLPQELRRAAFLRGWTCKEAVLKGIGCGTRDLDRCVVDLDPRRPPRITGPAATATHWRMSCWEPAAGYVAAVAAECHGPLELPWG